MLLMMYWGGNKMSKKIKQKEKSRVEIIIDEIKSGGFVESELDEIMDACEEALHKFEEG